MSLALCPQVVSQAPQYLRSSEKQATCEGCFSRQSVCSVISLHSGMSRAVHRQEFSEVDVDHWRIPVSLGFPFQFSLPLFSALEQAHCTLIACGSKWVTAASSSAFSISIEVVYLQRCFWFVSVVVVCVRPSVVPPSLISVLMSSPSLLLLLLLLL